jgi:hypothetical protein
MFVWCIFYTEWSYSSGCFIATAFHFYFRILRHTNPLLSSDSVNNILFQLTAAKQTGERRPLLGRRFLISENRRPLLGNNSVNTFLGKLLAYENERGFLCGQCRDVISKGRSYFSWVVQGRLWRQDLSASSWKISTVRAVARERLVTTQQAGKCLVGAVVIF